MKEKRRGVILCQSCGMPMRRIKDYGTNLNKSRNKEYCQLCFRRGKFSDSNISLEQMLNKVAVVMAKQMKMSEQQARAMAESFVPRLKRWR